MGLTVSWIFQGIGHHRRFRLFIDTVLGIGFAPALLKQGRHTTCFNCGLIPVKRIPGNAHHLTGFGDISQLFRQVQLPDLVLNDFLVSINHEGYLLLVMIESLHFHQNR
jgi:hypothetical protein